MSVQIFLCHDRANQFPMHVRQPEIATLEAVRQLLVIDAE